MITIIGGKDMTYIWIGIAVFCGMLLSQMIGLFVTLKLTTTKWYCKMAKEASMRLMESYNDE